MKAFITGATGFLGANLTRELLKNGFTVRALVRPGTDRRNLRGLAVESWEGDLRHPESLQAGLQGCDILFHAAADYRLWTRRPEEMYACNVTGTRNVLAAALAAGVERVVYTSSVGTLGNPGNGTPGSETTPVNLRDMVGHYKRSKYLAEREAESFVAQGLPLVIVNPSTPVGPHDVKPTPSGRFIVDYLNGQMPAYLDTGLNLVDVEDCARGHLLALEKGRVGEKYILGGENLSMARIFALLEEYVGLPAPRLRLPYYPLLLAACLNEALARLTGQRPLIPLTAVRMARKKMFFDTTKAVRELGLPRRPPVESLARAVEWFRENGYVR
jgi:dihydroflavonol-4-reductase